jgi:hypothetical protein
MLRPASSVPSDGMANWLLAAPHTKRARKVGMLAALREAPKAQGASTSTSAAKI